MVLMAIGCALIWLGGVLMGIGIERHRALKAHIRKRLGVPDRTVPFIRERAQP